MFDDDIPLPERHAGIPWATMGVGQCIAFPTERRTAAQAAVRMLNYLARAEDTGRRYEWRRVEGGIRVWRVA